MLIGVLVASVALVANFDPGDSLESRFLNECPKALLQLESHFAKAKGVARLGRPGGKVLAGPLDFATDGPRKMFRYTSSNVKVKATGKTLTFRVVCCLDGPKSFSLQAEGDGAFQIKSVGDDALVRSSFSTVFGRYLDASWMILNRRLVDLIRSKDFRLIAVREVVAGAPLVEAEFEASPINNKPTFYKVKLNPANSWSIVESEFRTEPASVSQIVKIDYGRAQGGADSPAYPASITLKDIDNRDSFCKFEKINFGPVDDSVFRIETYGLKALNYSRRDGRPGLSWLLALSGTVSALLVGSMMFKRAADQRR